MLNMRASSLLLMPHHLTGVAMVLQKIIPFRVGGGMSTIPGAWVTQSIDYSWQSGATRRGEQRIRSGWRTNRRALKKGADQN